MPLWYGLVPGGLATLYAVRIGAGNLLVSVLNAALFLGIGVLPFAATLVERRDRRKVMLTSWALAALAAAPLFLLPEIKDRLGTRWTLAIMAVSGMLYAGFYGAGAAAWTSTFRAAVPERISRRFLGVLRMAWQLASLAALAAAALFIGSTGSPERYRLIIGLLIVGHVARLSLVTGLPELAPAAVAAGGMAARLKGLLADAANRRFLRFSGLCSALTAMSAPAMWLYLHRDLAYGDMAVLGVTTIGLLGGFVTFPFWGRLAERRGETALYQSGLSLLLVALGLWLLTGRGETRGLAAEGRGTPGLFVAALFFIAKAGESALVTAFAHSAYRLRPAGTADPLYEALQPAAQWVAGAVGVLVGGAVVHLMGGWRPLGMSPFLLLFFLNGVAVILPLALVARSRPAAQV
jgi:MFS family permease